MEFRVLGPLEVWSEQRQLPLGGSKQRMLLAVSCDEVTSGKMPGPYTLLRPETRLSAQDVETICAAARRSEASAAGGR